MKKEYSVRLSFTDRKVGPGTGSSTRVEASSFPQAIAKAAREFWKALDTKQRNDVRRNGMKVEVQEGEEQRKEEREEKEEGRETRKLLQQCGYTN